MQLAKTSTKEEIMAEWVRRLRSGDYAQTERVLRNPIGFCCLGVLCEVAVDAGVIMAATQQANGDYSYGGEERCLPRAVRIWTGLDAVASFNDRSNQQTLTYQNDHDKKSFSEIADIIENNKFLED